MSDATPDTPAIDDPAAIASEWIVVTELTPPPPHFVRHRKEDIRSYYSLGDDGCMIRISGLGWVHIREREQYLKAMLEVEV